MDDATFNQQTQRVKDLLAIWQPVVGLMDWTIHIDFYRDQAEFARANNFDDGPSSIMAIRAHWEYKQAGLIVNCIQVEQHNDHELEAAVIHELTHCIVAEMRDWTPETAKHEERVVTDVTSAIQRARTMGRKQAKQRKR